MSGLVTQDQLDEAAAALRAAWCGPPGQSAEITDEQLADQLIELDHLHPYQADQLLAGYTKFDLGPYVVVDSIGQGGMGQVFKAEHTMMGRTVAIKVLPKSKTTPEAIDSFMREIRVLAQLDHHNLVRAYDAGNDGKVYYLVTEYVPGTDLRRLVRHGDPLSMEDAATIISQAALGLDHAHGRGLIHRDVKPGNLLVTPDGHTKVSDLGLAGFFGEEHEVDPRSGKIVGTADYLSPDQIRTPWDLTPAADIYGLGCTLYYAVTGKVPFPGGTTREKARRHCEEIPMHPRRRNPELDEGFTDVLADMMVKDPAGRIQTAEEVVQRFSPWTKDAVTSSRFREGLVTRTRSSTPPAAPPLPSGLAAEPKIDDGTRFDLRIREPDPGSLSSQTSQGTHPVAAGTEETSRMPPQIPPLPQTAESNGVSLPLILLLGMIPVAVMLAGLIVWLILR